MLNQILLVFKTVTLQANTDTNGAVSFIDGAVYEVKSNE